MHARRHLIIDAFTGPGSWPLGHHRAVVGLMSIAQRRAQLTFHIIFAAIGRRLPARHRSRSAWLAGERRRGL